VDLKVDFTFDEKIYRHYMNGRLSVLHCHHYMTLTTKAAEELNDLGGVRILRESAEDSIRPFLDDYIQQHGIASVEDKLSVGCEYYKVMGMGKMTAEGGDTGGTVRLSKSHVDQGWIKKWGPHDKCINHFTAGYIAAMFGAAFGKPARSYNVTETAAIVKGDSESVFRVTPA
jgi:predicted hydrocarbon binding protein